MLPANYMFQPGDGGTVTFPNDVMPITPGDEMLSLSDANRGILGSVIVNLFS